MDIGFTVDENFRVIAKNNKGGGKIESQSVESLLLMAILDKLEDIRCGIIDVEEAVSPR